MARLKVELAKHKTKQNPALPSREALLSFIRERSGKVGTREIARAFGLKNAARAELKRMLRDLADTGAIESRRKKLHQPGALPPVTLADVTGRDSRNRTPLADGFAHAADIARLQVPQPPVNGLQMIERGCRAEIASLHQRHRQAALRRVTEALSA